MSRQEEGKMKPHLPVQRDCTLPRAPQINTNTTTNQHAVGAAAPDNQADIVVAAWCVLQSDLVVVTCTRGMNNETFFVVCFVSLPAASLPATSVSCPKNNLRGGRAGIYSCLVAKIESPLKLNYDTIVYANQTHSTQRIGSWPNA